jgi:chromosomal replication initiator protein
MNTTTIWRTTLERLSAMPIDEVSKTWLQSAHLVDTPAVGADDIDAATASPENKDLSFTLYVTNNFARDVINTRWRRSLEDVLQEITGQPVTMTISDAGNQDNDDGDFSEQGFSYARNTTPHNPAASKRPATNNHFEAQSGPGTLHAQAYAGESLDDWDNEQRANILMHNRLNSRYTFETFIVGNSNRLAHAASLAVAEAPGDSYNPLFLYGGVGLGKTHLLHAIGHQGVQTGLVVLYVSSEQFTNEIVNAIRYRSTDEFRAKYRSVDILLVDDIQFIAGKDSTEEEFFHTFNSLYEMSKQIVICSDRPPKAIISLEERLRSRFEWGLIADIQPPDLETRMAILRVKADMLGYPVPDDIIAYMAGRVQNNIRELEGCLNRLIAYQQLHRTALTMEVARAAISSLGNDTREPRLDCSQIAQAVAEYYHLPLEDMCGKQRDKHIVMPRQIAMYLMRQETQASLLEIGQIFGGRDHSTVLHACEKIDHALNSDPTLRRDVLTIREQLLRE